MKTIKILVLLAAFMGLSACNTIHGMGKDIEAAGEAVQRNSK
jgi:predicted small secreted protein